MDIEALRAPIFCFALQYICYKAVLGEMHPDVRTSFNRCWTDNWNIHVHEIHGFALYTISNRWPCFFINHHRSLEPAEGRRATHSSSVSHDVPKLVCQDASILLELTDPGITFPTSVFAMMHPGACLDIAVLQYEVLCVMEYAGLVIVCGQREQAVFAWWPTWCQ